MKKSVAALMSTGLLAATMASTVVDGATRGVSVSKSNNEINAAILTDATDQGPTDPSQIVSTSIVLKLRNATGLAQYITRTITPGNRDYHKFISTHTFRSLYAPSMSDISNFIRYLAQHGIQAYAYPDGLLIKAVGPVSAFQEVFGATIHNYTRDGQRFLASNKPMRIPKIASNMVLTVAGPTNYSPFHSMNVNLAKNPDARPQDVTLPKSGTATGTPGQYTVGDVANLYNVNSLYDKGISGAGQTIGIATLAGFDPQDAYQYWDGINLKYTPNRITQIHVDGGGAVGADSGSGETSLDVEQAGGMAPNAKIIVYDAPNSDYGLVDVIFKAVSDNVVGSLSLSWGTAEAFYMANQQTGELRAVDQAYMEAAAQGITVLSASGDSGAYDTNRQLPYPYFSKVVSVDAPSSDPYVTAVGGTTLPGTYHLKNGDVTVPAERAWGWDYLNDYVNKYYGPFGIYTYGIFSVGGGGGVSALWPVPSYQKSIPTIQYTQAGQSLIDYTPSKPVDYLDAPAKFAGRNTPDISMNADPYSGYLVYSSTEGGWISNVGGTSFAAPQMNGMVALMNEYLGTRIGFMNPVLYSIAKKSSYLSGPVFNDIVEGDNWFYNALPGYDPATGLGTPNLANLADAFKNGGK